MKLFGLFSAVFCNVLLLVLFYCFSPNLDNFSCIENISLTGYIFSVALFCCYLLTFKKVPIYVNHSLFVIFMIISFIYLHTVLYCSIKMEDYESYSEWNASQGLSAIFFIPFVFVISIVQGLCYDYLLAKQRI